MKVVISTIVLFAVVMLAGCGIDYTDSLSSNETQTINSQLTDEEASMLTVTDPAYLEWYCTKYGIDLYKWGKFEEYLIKMSDIISTSDENSMMFMKKESGWFQDDYYVRTADVESEYVYFGNISDNKPDGFGVLTSPKGDIYYIGDFKDGMYHGFGAIYNIPDGNDEAYLMQVYGYDALENMRNRINYCYYFGEFEYNKFNGKGNQLTYPHIFFDIENEEFEADRHISIVIADFVNDEIDGDFKYYSESFLSAEGTVEKGLLSDEGTATVYFPASTQVMYDGEFKNGKYHGKGTLYDEQGNTVYSGNWEYGDYSE